jgi:hypothetical protein
VVDPVGRYGPQVGKELAATLVRTQMRVRAAEKALARFLAEGRDRDPRESRAHYGLRHALTLAQNDALVIERMLRD